MGVPEIKLTIAMIPDTRPGFTPGMMVDFTDDITRMIEETSICEAEEHPSVMATLLREARPIAERLAIVYQDVGELIVQYRNQAYARDVHERLVLATSLKPLVDHVAILAGSMGTQSVTLRSSRWSAMVSGNMGL